MLTGLHFCFHMTIKSTRWGEIFWKVGRSAWRKVLIITLKDAKNLTQIQISDLERCVNVVKCRIFSSKEIQSDTHTVTSFPTPKVPLSTPTHLLRESPLPVKSDYASNHRYTCLKWVAYKACYDKLTCIYLAPPPSPGGSSLKSG